MRGIKLYNHQTGVVTNLLVWMVLVLALAACDPVHKKEDAVIPPKSKASILIGNEGQFQHGDASLTLLDIANNVIVPDAFKTANSRPLGDILQSVSLRKEHLYLIVNNSGKIEIVNRSDFKSTGTISGFVSPRYIEFINDNKAYVSEIFSNTIRIIDPAALTITGSIDCGGWQEEMKLLNNKLYVTSNQRKKILVIDPASDQIIDSIPVAANPATLSVDAYGRLWVGCNGENQTNASLFCIDALFDTVIRKIMLPDIGLRKIQADNSRTTLFVLTNRLFKLNLNDTIVADVPFLANPLPGHSWYGFGIDPQTNDIYISDALDFQQQSDILHFNQAGTFLGQFKAGINAASFCFDYD